MQGEIEAAAKAAQFLGSGVLGLLMLIFVLRYMKGRDEAAAETAKLQAAEKPAATTNGGPSGEQSVMSWVNRISEIVEKSEKDLVVPRLEETERLLREASAKHAEAQTLQTAMLQKLDRLEQLISQRHERGIQERADLKAHLEEIRTDIKKQFMDRTPTFEAIRATMSDVKGMCISILERMGRRR